MTDTAKPKGVRGQYSNPDSMAKPCPYGCGKRGRAGSMVSHARACKLNPERKTPAPLPPPRDASREEPAPTAPPPPSSAAPHGARLTATIERISLKPIPKVKQLDQ